MLDRGILGMIGLPAAKAVLDANELLVALCFLSQLLLAGDADQTFLIIRVEKIATANAVHRLSSRSLGWLQDTQQ